MTARALPKRGRAWFKPLALAAGTVGNVLEWYDFGLYGFYAPVVARLFFPSHDPLAALIGAYGGFAIGFAVRPLGGIFFGYLGDRIGRNFVLVTSVVMMGIATTAITFLPTYAQIGFLAPVLLLAVRVFQGFSVGGEFTGSVAYLVETAPPNRRGFTGSFANIGSTSGILLAAGVAATTLTFADPNTLSGWAWRLPFLFGGALAAGAFFLRRRLPDTGYAPGKQRAAAEPPLKRAFKRDPRTMMIAILFTSGYGMVNYLTMVFLPTYAGLYGGLSEGAALQVTTAAQAVALIVVPLAGWATDSVLKRRSMLILVFAAEFAAALACFALTRGGGLAGFAIAQILFGILFALVMGTEPAMMIEFFPRDYRLSGYSFAFNLGIGIAGGTAPLIATWLIVESGNALAPAFYLMLGAAAACLAAYLMTDRSRRPLR